MVLHLKYLIPLFLLFTIDVSRPQAQGAYFWSEPILLFQVDDTASIRNPFVISDSYGNVHVFWTVSSKIEGELVLIYYMRQDAIGWTTPVDIVAAPLARAATATIGPDDVIYLIWNGHGGISYSHAPIQGAEHVNNWSAPVVVADANIHAGIATSPTGEIHIAYAGLGNSGVFEQSLDPYTLTWSSPRHVSLNSLVNTAADYVQISVSRNGTIHVVWTELYYPEGWPPRGIFYSQSEDGGNSWSSPMLLAGDGFDQVNVYALNDEDIYVAWNGMAGVGGRYYRWSSDGGQSWSQMEEIIPAGLGGTEGYPQILGDETGTVHMLTTYSNCAWYTYLINHKWAAPVCISSEEARASEYIEEPALGLSEGNKLHAVFFDDEKRIWYTTRAINASWIPPKVMENVPAPATATVASTQTAVATVIATDVSLGQQIELDRSAQPRLNPAQILLISVSPVLLIIVLIAVIQSHKNKVTTKRK